MCDAQQPREVNMKYPDPLKRHIDLLNPICALKDHCFDAADRRRQGVYEGDTDAEREMLIYGKLWWILLIVWDHLNGQHENEFTPSFEESILVAFSGDLDDVMTAMYG
jgi:hypothetical protein